jgi:hypothetical protein
VGRTPTLLHGKKGSLLHYKGIILEWLVEHPAVYRRLLKKRLLKTTLKVYASKLMERHYVWQRRLAHMNPPRELSQLADDALPVALKELEYSLLAGLPPEQVKPLPMLEAMALVKRRSPLA